jgi:predicted RNA-binding Zn-ribbon protein involved in translation (DUF1610 family)
MKNKRGDFVKVCPKCGSKKVTQRGMVSRNAYSQNYVCLACGFQSPLFPEISREEAKILPDKKQKFISSRLPIFADNYKKSNLQRNSAALAVIIMIFILLLLLLYG